MSKADEFRQRADEASKQGREAKSLKKGAEARNRADGLNQLADNEDWLDGKAKAKQ
jgi:hypothetical protein